MTIKGDIEVIEKKLLTLLGNEKPIDSKEEERKTSLVSVMPKKFKKKDHLKYLLLFMSEKAKHCAGKDVKLIFENDDVKCQVSEE